MIRVEFLFWKECPSHEKALSRLKSALQKIGIDYEIKVIEVKTEDDAKRWQFPGSPTIRINGADIQPETSKGNYSLSCRAYIIEGKVLPVPTEDFLIKSIRKILGKR